MGLGVAWYFGDTAREVKLSRVKKLKTKTQDGISAYLLHFISE
jgi:hypothetical protein